MSCDNISTSSFIDLGTTNFRRRQELRQQFTDTTGLLRIFLACLYFPTKVWLQFLGYSTHFLLKSSNQMNTGWMSISFNNVLFFAQIFG